MILLAPPAILGWWAFSYLRSCVGALAAPGVPVTFDYKTPGGILHLTAASYSLDLDQGVLVVTRPRVTSPEGHELLSVERINVTGLYTLLGAAKSVRVRAKTVRAELVRLPNGKLEIQRFLSKREGPSSQTPFEVDVENAQVTLVDLAGKRPFRQRISTDRVLVSGLGDDWVASTYVVAPGVGRVALDLQSFDKDGLHISADSGPAGLELIGLFRHLKTTPSLAGSTLDAIDAASLRAIGPVQLYVPKDKDARVESRLELVAEAPRYQTTRMDRIVFRGVLREGGLQGQAEAMHRGLRADWNGAATWGDGKVALGGAVTAAAGSRADLPELLDREIPAKAAFDTVRFNGWVSATAADDVRVQGDVAARTLRWDKDVLQAPRFALVADPRRVRLDVRELAYADQRVRGTVALDLKGKTVQGGLVGPNLDISRLALRFGQRDLAGHLNLNATVAGPWAKPEVSLVATGAATLKRPEGPLRLGTFEANAQWQGEGLRLRRAVVRGPLGLLAATGTIGVGRPGLGIAVVARRLDPSRLFPDFKGQANFVGQIGGTLDRPVATGYAEAYNVQAGNVLIPAVRADLVADRRHVAIQDIFATSGPADLTGRASLTLATRRLSGQLRARGIQIADFTPGREDIVGSLDIPSVTLGGTLAHPQVAFKASGQNLVIRGGKIDTVAVTAHGSAAGIVLDEGRLEANGGTLVATGRYDLKRKQGVVNAEATAIDLAPVAQQISSEVTLDGHVSGKATVSIENAQLHGLEGTGKFDRVAVNGTGLGDGSWTVKKDGTAYQADVRIGTLERYLELDDVKIDPDTRALSGAVYLNNLVVGDLISMAGKNLDSLSPDTRQSLRQVDGRLNFGAQFGGNLDRPEVTVESLELADLKYGNIAIGTVAGTLALKNRRWDINSIALTGPLAHGSVSGYIEEGGDVRFGGELLDLDFTQLGAAVPAVASTGGRLRDFYFAVRGPAKSPRVRASMNIDRMFTNPKIPESGLSIGLSEIRVSDEEGVSVNGVVSYRGFEGTLEAKTPFEWPGRIPEKGTVYARLGLADRDLSAVTPFVSALDPTRTKGTIGGELVAEGAPDSIKYRGQLLIQGDQLAMQLPGGLPTAPRAGVEATPVEDTLQNFRLAVDFKADTLSVSASGKSSRGGNVAATASVPVGQLSRLASSDQGMGAILDNKVTGRLDLGGFEVKQNLGAGTYVGAILNGAIQLDGTLRNPAFRTENPLRLAHVDTVLPSFQESTGEKQPPSINPTFDIQFQLADAARVRTTAAELYLGGSGKVGGNLAEPDVHAALLLEKGTLALPGGRVRLEQGGTVDVSFTANPRETVARADVDLEGHTAITALRFGETYERYEITLGVKGNLLEDGGLTLNATSDPADLSKDRILALLGRTDVLEAIGNNPRSSDTEKQIRNALTSYALPALTDTITNKIAQGLGLDYLSVEYNPYTEASFALAKSIGSGFFIQGRRQISAPPPGFLAQYDIRLVYRPRRVRGALSRISFSVGADEQRPIKATIEYGVRF